MSRSRRMLTAGLSGHRHPDFLGQLKRVPGSAFEGVDTGSSRH
jgi:hypothetical protein